MDYLVPVNNYLVVLPNGKGIGFLEQEEAKAYINRYYEERIEKVGNLESYASYDMYEGKSREDIAAVLGAEEEIAEMYSIEGIIETVQTMDEASDDEKEEIIGSLLRKECKIDTYSLGLQSILVNVDPIRNKGII